MFYSPLEKSNQSMFDVLITHSGNRVGYNVLRSLAKGKLKVGVSDSSKLGMSLWSRLRGKKLIHPPFYKDNLGFIEWLEETLLKYKPKVYIPTYEEIFIVAKFLNRLKKTGTIIPISDLETLKKLHLKNEVMDFARSLAIPTPLTVQPNSSGDIKHFVNQAGYPIVVKALNTNSAKGVFYFYSLEKLLRKYEELSCFLQPNEYPILQEYIPGNGYGVSLLLNKGKTKALFTHKRLREKKFTGGTSTKRISSYNISLEKYSIKLLESINFHGVAMVEFKYNENKQKGYLIDVNPRFWGSLALPIAAGIDFPLLLYKMAIDGDLNITSNYKKGVVCRWIVGDLRATLSKTKNTKTFIGPLKEYFTFNEDCYDDFYLDDLLPFVFEIIHYLLKFLKTRSFNPTDEASIDVNKI